MTPYLLVLAVLLGIAPGLIAHGKGRNFLIWWLYGVLLGPVALLHAILLRKRIVPSPLVATPRRSRWRSNWPAVLWAATSVAIAIVAVTIYGLLSPPRFDLPAPVQETARSADRAPSRAPTGAPKTETAPPAERTAETGPPPTVRVTLRREPPPPPEEKLERAPVMPVERMTSGDSVAPDSRLERTTPRETPAPALAPQKLAALPAPADPAPPPPPPPATAPVPAEPPVAMLAPADKAAETETKAPAPASEAPAAEAPAPSPAKPAPTDVTAVGETVRIVQIALREKGYDPGPANGRAGKKTQGAIRKYQADRKLEPTGTIDYALLESLGIVGPRVHAFRPPAGMTVGR